VTGLQVAAAIGVPAAALSLILQAAAAPNVELAVGVILSTAVLGTQAYLIKRVGSIPKEESALRHEAANKFTAALGETYDMLDVALQRAEARIMGRVDELARVAADERHRLDDRIRELERYLPRGASA